MNIVRDEFGPNFSALMEKLNVVSPSLGESEKRRIILPTQLGDLKRPEFIEILSMKIQEIENLDNKLKEGSLCRDDYCARVKKIISSS